MYFYKENKMGAKIFKKKYVGPILMFAHLKLIENQFHKKKLCLLKFYFHKSPRQSTKVHKL